MTGLQKKDLLELLLDLLRIPGLSGGEAKAASYVAGVLRRNGCKPDWMRYDAAQKRLGPDFATGNLIVRIPGTVRGPRLLLSAHLDTVPLCRGARPVRRGNRICAAGKTALGADNRAGVACILAAAIAALKNEFPHPPLTFLFTVAEEIGLKGVQNVSRGMLGRPRFGFNYDSGSPSEITIGAVAAIRWEAEIYGRSSHAGSAPEKGVSAAVIFADAAAALQKRGMLGSIRKNGRRGTANIGIVKGGEATNQVLDYLYVKGECRSHDARFLRFIERTIAGEFRLAAAAAKSADGKRGAVRFKSWMDYPSFLLRDDEEVVRFAAAVMDMLGGSAGLSLCDGGLDANFLNAHGIPTVSCGTGAHRPHTVDEYIDIEEFLFACRAAKGIAGNIAGF